MFFLLVRCAVEKDTINNSLWFVTFPIYRAIAIAKIFTRGRQRQMRNSTNISLNFTCI